MHMISEAFERGLASPVLMLNNFVLFYRGYIMLALMCTVVLSVVQNFLMTSFHTQEKAV